MAERVREFLRAHKTDGVGEGLGLAKLEVLLQRAEVLAAQQRAGLVARRSATKRRKDLRGALHGKLLLYLRAVGAVAAKEITMARGMLEKATTHKDVLVQGPKGLPRALRALGRQRPEPFATLRAGRAGAVQAEGW